MIFLIGERPKSEILVFKFLWIPKMREDHEILKWSKTGNIKL